jgi:hypothetical protein
MFDGLDAMIKINWSKSENAYGGCQRIAFIIADAPPHGNKFTCEYSGDNYENGCPCNISFNDLLRGINNNEIGINFVSIDNDL